MSDDRNEIMKLRREIKALTRVVHVLMDVAMAAHAPLLSDEDKKTLASCGEE